MRHFTSIKGLSTIRMMPRLGRIRGGIKIQNSKGVIYPKETAWFVVPPEVARVYGEKPTELDILLPANDREIIFPQAYEFYGASKGLKCTGDGERAMRYDETIKSMQPVECPCELLEQKKCSQKGHLMFILPKVNIGGVYQIDTGSYNSIVDINSSLDYVISLVGRFALVSLRLIREPRETYHNGKKQTHHTMRIELSGNINHLNALKEDTNKILAEPQYSLPAPTQENPELDDVPVYPDIIEDTLLTPPFTAPTVNPPTFSDSKTEIIKDLVVNPPTSSSPIRDWQKEFEEAPDSLEMDRIGVEFEATNPKSAMVVKMRRIRDRKMSGWRMNE